MARPMISAQGSRRGCEFVTLVPSHYGAGACQQFARVHGDLPGSWIGIESEDLRHLLEGHGDRATAAGWVQDKLYDAAWVEVSQNGRYTAPDGQVYCLSEDDVGAIILTREQEG